MAAGPRRVLLAGDVKGNFGQLFKRVASVQKSNGPFDCLLCVGGFFADAGGSDAGPASDALGGLGEYIQGAKQAPLPTYFIGAFGTGAAEALEHARGRPSTGQAAAADEGGAEGGPQGGAEGGAEGAAAGGPTENGSGTEATKGAVQVAPNIFFLRGATVTIIQGLKVAFLAKDSGSPGAAAEQALMVKLVDEAADCPAVDLLLTNEWPKGVLSGVAKDQCPPQLEDSTAEGSFSSTVTTLATELKPRYHIAGGAGVFFARAPYINEEPESSKSPAGPEGGVHVTRFIGLAPVGNASKQKFLHALSLVAAASMSPEELAARPPDATPSPYALPPPPTKPKQWHGNFVSSGVPGQAEPRVASEELAPKPVAKPAWAAKVEEEEASALAARLASSNGTGEQYWRYSGSTKRQRTGVGAPETRPCLEFSSKGACSRGDSCRYMHALPSGAPLPRGLCFDFFQKGQCERGEQCRFKHSLEPVDESRAGTSGEGGPAGEGGARGEGGGIPLQDLPKGVCYDFVRKGQCSRGDACRFRHSMEEAPPPRSAQQEPAPCWFCLSSPDVDAHLVASVGDNCYVALAKGGLTPDHVLVLPIEHFPNVLALPSDALAECQRYTAALKKCFARQGAAAVVFERYLQMRGATHAHINVVPVPLGSSDAVGPAFVSSAEKLGFGFQTLPPDPKRSPSQLADELKRLTLSGPYFRVELPDGSHLVHAVERGSRHPMQFGREVLAALLGIPERADWKACKASREEEEQLAQAFKHKFQPFDPFL